MLDLIYSSRSVLVVNKPSGLLTQAPPGIDSLEVRIKAWLQGDRAAGESPYLGVPHRLDRPASGAIVFALDRPAARKLSRQFERRQVEKTYWAIVAGRLTASQGTWTDFVAKDKDAARCRVVPPDHPDAQLAILHYRVLGEVSHRTWLEIRLETGRTHQVRVQAAARGHALLGDALYGSTDSFGPMAVDIRENPIALHARRLVFIDPSTKLRVDAQAEVSSTWKELLGDVEPLTEHV